jgi:hypothetical protein
MAQKPPHNPLLTHINPRPFGMFRNMQSFYGEQFLARLSKPNLQDRPLSPVTLHICRLFRHPLPEEAPCCCDRNQLITELLPLNIKIQ